MDEQRSAALGDQFDVMYRKLADLPDVVKTTSATIPVVNILSLAQTWIVQTFRQREQGDTLFLQYIEAGRSMRIVIPPKVAAAIARQRDTVTSKNRKKGAQQAVETRRQGIAIVAEDTKGNR